MSVEQDALKMFKVIADETRFKILLTLIDNEKCVNCIKDDLNQSKSLISHQLRVLKDNNLVSSRKDGRFVYYKIKDQHIVEIINQMIEHAKE